MGKNYWNNKEETETKITRSITGTNTMEERYWQCYIAAMQSLMADRNTTYSAIPHSAHNMALAMIDRYNQEINPPEKENS